VPHAALSAVTASSRNTSPGALGWRCISATRDALHRLPAQLRRLLSRAGALLRTQATASCRFSLGRLRVQVPGVSLRPAWRRPDQLGAAVIVCTAPGLCTLRRAVLDRRALWAPHNRLH
jgi:hypothetical protein